MRKRLTRILFCLAGVVLNVWVACGLLLPGAWTGRNDFLSLYAGARLSGTADLYSREAVRNTQLAAIGETGESLRFSRLPYYGLLLKPLGWLPYRVAFGVWVAAGVAALVAFAVLWRGAMVCCWFLPAFVALFNGQDGGLLILWVALAAMLVRRDRHFWAGVVLALCASKYHLAILLPLVIVAQQRWRVAAGGAVAGVVMLAVSFAAGGWNWPREYYAVLTDGRLHPSVANMPSLHGMQMGIAAEAAGVLVLVVCVYLAARASSFEWAMAVALAAGLLVGFHTYLADCVVLLPAIILAMGRLRVLAIALATPVPWLLLQMAAPLPNVTRMLILVVVVGMAVVSTRQVKSATVGR
jgi:hypothetical protein